MVGSHVFERQDVISFVNKSGLQSLSVVKLNADIGKIKQSEGQL